MPAKKRTTLRCPTCRKLVLRNDPEFPFCSDRCRLIDLGKDVARRRKLKGKLLAHANRLGTLTRKNKSIKATGRIRNEMGQRQRLGRAGQADAYQY